MKLPGARSEIWNHFGFKVNSESVILNKTEVIFRECYGDTSNLNSHLHTCTKTIKIVSTII